MKRNLYIFCTMILGVLLSLILHATVEAWYIGLLVGDFGAYGLGLSWATWFIIHHVATVILFVFGVGLGYWLGVRWWQKVYVEKRHWLLKREK